MHRPTSYEPPGLQLSWPESNRPVVFSLPLNVLLASKYLLLMPALPMEVWPTRYFRSFYPVR